MDSYLPLSNDLVFKYVFGTQEQIRVLQAFLNAILEPVLDKKLVELTLENPFNLQEALDEKLSILDIRARDESGRILNLEIQVAKDVSYAKRALYYACRMHAQQLKSGESYEKLSPVISISLMNWVWEHSAKLHSIFRLKELESLKDFPNYLEFHMIQLPFLSERDPISQRTLLEKWLLLIAKGEDYMSHPSTDLEELLKIEGIAEAVAAYEKCNSNKEMRYLIEAREKALRDQISRETQAKNEGLQQGLEMGLQKGIEQGLQQGLHKGLEGTLKTILQFYLDGDVNREKTEHRIKSLFGQGHDELVQSYLDKV